MKTTNQIRKHFLNFFEKEGHTIVPSAPIIPHNDPTLMFTAAGMVPFKNLFTGQEKRDYTTATSSQKCVRAGGKHNDLENVGYTPRHHTFFEMMGNFSFGDYFKEQAIEMAWRLLTKEFALPKDKLIVTVYHTDEEAIELWKKIAGISDDRIIRISTSDNFWSAGDTGPCGPSSEIFYDHGEHIEGGLPGTPEEDGDRFVEIWNLVFMQYDQISKDERVNLPNPCIDTGMGLERMSAVMQGTHDNYKIDMFQKLINKSADLTNQAADDEFNISHRVISDHLRASAFLIADGVLPSNEGRGYVLRRIMRRGMRHAHLMGMQDPLMYKLLPTLIEEMGDVYPELKTAEALTRDTLRIEEERFKKTLDKGLSLLEAETEKLNENEDLSGEVAFKLYDTYGFPLDLTQDVLKREQNRAVNTKGFEVAMEKQREMARKSWKGSGDTATDSLWFELQEEFGATEFLGYTSHEAEGQILAIIDIKSGKRLDQAKTGDEVMFLTNQTPFYAESGGQVGDKGWGETALGASLTITDTQKKLGSLFIHIAIIDEGSITTLESIKLQIDSKNRTDIAANHSATHILNAALRRHLGDHISQKGSLVDAERLRFDISHPSAISSDDLEKIELEINEVIRKNSPVSTRLMPVDEARKSGAVAMFGEKYDDEVRVLSMGGYDPEHTELPYSMELCGGTHVTQTGEIGLLKILSESAVSSGIRRIEAVTGRAAFLFLSKQNKTLQNIAEKLKTSTIDAEERVKTLVVDRKKMEKEISEMRRKIASFGDDTDNGSSSDVKDINGIPFASRIIHNIPAKELKPMADDMKKELGSVVVTLIAINDGKASIVIGVTDDLTGKVNAVDLVRIGSEKLGGKGGGGRPDMAQAGGPDGDLANDAVTAIETALVG